MTVRRLDNVSIVVEDLDAAVEFFVELGLHLQGRAQIDGEWSSHVTGLPGNRAEIAMMRTPDGHGGVELTTYQEPALIVREPLAPNTLGFHRVMFAVDDIADVVARLEKCGASLVGDIVQYEDAYRLCYVRSREGWIIGLAEQLGGGESDT